MKPLIVGISGKQRSGKTTLAEHLAREHGAMLRRFAEPVYAAARRVGVGDTLLQTKPPQVRRLLQSIGPALELCRPDWRAVTMAGEVQDCLSLADVEARGGRPLIVIDDLRLRVEVQVLIWIASSKGLDLRLVRMERVGFDRTGLEGAGDVTETDLDDFDAWDHVFEVPNGKLGPGVLARIAGVIVPASDVPNVTGG